MRIALVGHFRADRGTGDIGTKNIAHSLADVLEGRCEIRRFDIKHIGSLLQMRRFQPDILHFILDPSMAGMCAARLFSLASRSRKTVISATNPSHVLLKTLTALCKPDLILVQSDESEQRFQKLGMATRFIPNGVDTGRFRPVTPSEKAALRSARGFTEEDFVILHAGPIIQGRNLQALIPLCGISERVVVIGRTPADAGLSRQLVSAGCRVITDYQPDIERWYQLADCYIFPADPENRGYSIEIPLSVLEAMSANLPVITTKFGGLPRMFPDEGNGLCFIDRQERIPSHLNAIKNHHAPVATRNWVLPYSWDRVARQVLEVYEDQC